MKKNQSITGYRHFQYLDDFTCAADKQIAIKVFERFYKKKIDPSEVKEVFMKDFNADAKKLRKNED